MSNKLVYASSLASAAADQMESRGPNQPILGREEDMAPNRGGGYGFVVTFTTWLLRFLILGSGEGYYTSAKFNTKEAIATLKTKMTEGRAGEILDQVKDIYNNDRAAKQDPVFVALAFLCSCDNNQDENLRREAWKLVSQLRTFSHLCTFLNFYMSVDGGWGRMPKKYFNQWFQQKNAHDLLYQVFKYLSRDGWTARDLLRCTHVDGKKLSPGVQMALRIIVLYGKKDLTTADAFTQARQFAVDKQVSDEDLAYLDGIRDLKILQETSDSTQKIIQLVNQHRFTREFLPTWSLKDVHVLMALLMTQDHSAVKMPMTALVRSLATMTVRGVFADATVVSKVVAHLNNLDTIKKSHIHPAALCIAWKQYSAGQGDKGKLTWNPVHEIVRALEDAVYLAFGNVPATGKRILHCYDGSGSMIAPMGVAGNMTSAEAVALMGLVYSRQETAGTQQHCVFSGGWNASASLRSVIMTPTSCLADAARITQLADWACTDCSLPMETYIKKFRELSPVDQRRFHDDPSFRDQCAQAGQWFPETFVVYTDNDVNAGRRHPVEALKEYRELTGIPARMAVVATQASRVSIADPKDSGMMDLVGFDAQLPRLLHDFVAGQF